MPALALRRRALLLTAAVVGLIVTASPAAPASAASADVRPLHEVGLTAGPFILADEQGQDVLRYVYVGRTKGRSTVCVYESHWAKSYWGCTTPTQLAVRGDLSTASLSTTMTIEQFWPEVAPAPTQTIALSIEWTATSPLQPPRPNVYTPPYRVPGEYMVLGMWSASYRDAHVTSNFGDSDGWMQTVTMLDVWISPAAP